MAARPTIANAPTYGTAQARYKRAAAVLGNASERIRWSFDPDDYAADMATEAAMQILDAAMHALNAEEAATRKRFGVGIYQPYGRAFKRRY